MLTDEVRLLIVTLKGRIVFVVDIFVARVLVAYVTLLMVLHMAKESFLIVESESAELAERVIDGDRS